MLFFHSGRIANYGSLGNHLFPSKHGCQWPRNHIERVPQIIVPFSTTPLNPAIFCNRSPIIIHVTLDKETDISAQPTPTKPQPDYGSTTTKQTLAEYETLLFTLSIPQLSLFVLYTSTGTILPASSCAASDYLLTVLAVIYYRPEARFLGKLNSYSEEGIT